MAHGTSPYERRVLLGAQAQPVRSEVFFDFLDRLLAEVRDRRQFVLGLRDEIADGLNADALEAVVRPNPELELLDHDVVQVTAGALLFGLRLAERLDDVRI